MYIEVLPNGDGYDFVPMRYTKSVDGRYNLVFSQFYRLSYEKDVRDGLYAAKNGWVYKEVEKDGSEYIIRVNNFDTSGAEFEHEMIQLLLDGLSLRDVVGVMKI